MMKPSEHDCSSEAMSKYRQNGFGHLYDKDCIVAVLSPPNKGHLIFTGEEFVVIQYALDHIRIIDFNKRLRWSKGYVNKLDRDITVEVVDEQLWDKYQAYRVAEAL